MTTTQVDRGTTPAGVPPNSRRKPKPAAKRRKSVSLPSHDHDQVRLRLIAERFARAASSLVAGGTEEAGIGLATLYRDSQFDMAARELAVLAERQIARAAWNEAFECDMALKFPKHPRTLMRKREQSHGG